VRTLFVVLSRQFYQNPLLSSINQFSKPPIVRQKKHCLKLHKPLSRRHNFTALPIGLLSFISCASNKLSYIPHTHIVIPFVIPAFAMSTKRKLPTKLGQPAVKQSAKILGKQNLDESRTVVSGGGQPTKSNTNGITEVVNISTDSSGEDEANSEEGSGDESAERGAEDAPAQPKTEDVAMEDLDGAEEEGPSLGELARANAAEPIDVAAAFEDPSIRTLTYPKGAQIQPPSGASLGTVLSQALKSNDVALLESCLQTRDVNTIRATIQRLDSPLAGTLLHKLAERLFKRPGRAGSLMVWVQWSLVTHGGYLATQRDLVNKLAELNKVIDDRQKGLQNLLSLKGKLDMLEAQIALRRSMQDQRRNMDEDDEGVIYVEGQEESDVEEVAVNGKPQRVGASGDLEDVSEGEESEDMPTTGFAISDDEEAESSDEDDLIDDEAEETDKDSGDEEDVDHDDQDSEGDAEESDDAAQIAPPSKMQRLGGLTSRRR